MCVRSLPSSRPIGLAARRFWRRDLRDERDVEHGEPERNAPSERRQEPHGLILSHLTAPCAGTDAAHVCRQLGPRSFGRIILSYQQSSDEIGGVR